MSVELVAVVPILVLVTILLVQAFLAASAVDQVAKAARDGARVAARGGDGAAAARAALPDWVKVRDVRVGSGGSGGCAGVCTTVVVDLPVGLPGFAALTDITVERSADFPAAGG